MEKNHDLRSRTNKVILLILLYLLYFTILLIITELLQLETKCAESIDCCNQLKTENLSRQLTAAELKFEVSKLNNQLQEFKEYQLSAEFSSKLSCENTELRTTVSKLQSEFVDFKSDVDALEANLRQLKEGQLPTVNSTSLQQQEVNSNIVIRGVDFEDTCNESEATGVFKNICSHLGIDNNIEFEPVSVKLLQPRNSNIKTKSAKTIQVRLRSSDTKREFLQIRRSKKNIFPTDIGLKQQSTKSILIAEQLTKENQELLFAARSLRGTNKFKFVCSNNGQILVRPQQNSKVIRITDLNHVNQGLPFNLNLCIT